MLVSPAPEDSDLLAPGSEIPTTVPPNGSFEDLDRRLGVVEGKLFDDIEPRMVDIELGSAVDLFLRENHRAVPPHHKRQMHAHAEPTKYGKHESTMLPQHLMSKENGLERAKREMKHEIIAALAVFLKEELCTLVDGSSRTVQNVETSLLLTMEARCSKDAALPVEQPTLNRVSCLAGAPTADQHSSNSKSLLKDVKCSDTTYAAFLDAVGEPRPESSPSQSVDVSLPVQSQSNPLDRYSGNSLGTLQEVKQFRLLQKQATRRRKFGYTAAEYEDFKKSWELREQMYEFQGSAWDVGMFPFVQRIGRWNSLIALFMFWLNALAQNSLNVCIYANFIGGEISEGYVEDLRTWRMTVAHDVRFMDKITQQSLARKVCNNGGTTGGLYMSGNVQDSLVRALQYGPSSKYFGPSGDFLQRLVVDRRPEWIGMFMCVMALFIWWSTCYLEFRQCLSCCEGVYYIPRGKQTKLITVEGTEDIALQSIHPCRKAWCAFVLANRFAVVAIILYVGSMYLLNSLEIRDLILNAVTLELILDLDELIYAALVPLHVRHFMYCLEPVPKVMGSCFYKNFQYEILIFCGMLAIGIAVSLVFLVNQVACLEDMQKNVCAGYLDFVYSIDPGGAVIAVPTYAPAVGDAFPEVGSAPVAGRIGSLENNYQYRAVQEIVNDWRAIRRGPGDSLSDTASTLIGSRLSLTVREAMPLGERMAQLNPTCADLSTSNANIMVWPSAFILNMVRERLAEVGITHITDSVCTQTKRMCSWDNETGIILRKWCSHSCGCDLPNSSLMMTRSSQGCPNTCHVSTLYEDALNHAVCVDQAQSSPEFQSYLEGFHALTESYSSVPGWVNLLNTWISSLETNGCAAHDLGVFGDLCSSASAFELKPLHHICPVTCGCKIAPHFGVSRLPPGQPELCPRSCVNYTSSHYHQPPDLSLHVH